MIRCGPGVHAGSSTFLPGIGILNKRRTAHDVDDPHAQCDPFDIGQFQFLAGDKVDRLLFSLINRDVRSIEISPVMGITDRIQPALQPRKSAGRLRKNDTPAVRQGNQIHCKRPLAGRPILLPMRGLCPGIWLL